MTFDDIWNQLVRKQPKLKSSEAVVEVKAAKLKSLLRQVYAQGQKSVPARKSGLLDKYSDIFGGL